MTAKPDKCRIHLPGNVSCLQPAVYSVSVQTVAGVKYWRPVCGHHLEAAINQGLGEVPWGTTVGVQMHASTDVVPAWDKDACAAEVHAVGASRTTPVHYWSLCEYYWSLCENNWGYQIGLGVDGHPEAGRMTDLKSDPRQSSDAGGVTCQNCLRLLGGAP
jgi:hypothetical protein